MNRRIKKTRNLIRNAFGQLPNLTIFGGRRTNHTASYILGAIGMAVVGGIAALMVLSPRTRHRALTTAKDVVGKVQHQAEDLGLLAKNGASTNTYASPSATE